MLKKIAFLALILCISSINVLASGGEEGKINTGEMIMEHISDAHEWHFADGLTLPLPVIVYSEQDGLKIFSSSKFHHGTESHAGFMIEDGHLVAEDGHEFVDFSITKNVAQLFINALILIAVFVSLGKTYKRDPRKAPKGLQNLLEPIILFVRDEIVKPNLGKKTDRFLPYMLTLFFFIWLGNLMGLLPGAANLTGNIAVTMVLAAGTLILTLFNANKYYWGHIFWPPGVPVLIKPIIVVVEFIGIFTKPFSLMIRLFVAITAGHIVLLSLLALAFIFHSYLVGVGGTLVVFLITLIELLVATIQAYVFTLFSSMYIGQAVEEHH